MHEDDRGVIRDLLVTPNYSITHVTFKEGAIRGNHYHKKTVQYDFILGGELQCYYDKNEVGKGDVVVTPGNSVTHAPGESHAYKALKESEIISICFGVRKGEDYEKDTFRLEIPLVKWFRSLNQLLLTWKNIT